jgi:CheY-like chemotaxis protein
MVEWGAEAYIPGVRFVALPVQALSIANVLNGRPDRGYMEASGGMSRMRFIIPEARLLIVDDIATNLKVAEGLLAPYGAVVDTCWSGPEAVELVKRGSYDIVFMDHMMPGMDGVEATALIRAWETKKAPGSSEEDSQAVIEIPPGGVPIIALTANAVSGMKEYFLSKGFNDFLSKPIDMSKLDEILVRWIPRSKKKKSDISTPLKPPVDKTAEHLKIPGVNVKQGIAATGGTGAGYRKVLALFHKDALERLLLLRRFAEGESVSVGQNDQQELDALSLFVTQVHALKSASASIGAAEVSAQAAALEAAGKAGDMTAIIEALPVFTQQLAALAEGIEAALGIDQPETGQPDPVPKEKLPEKARTLLNELTTALETRKADAVDRLLEELGRQDIDAETREMLDTVSDDVLMAEYSKALESITKLRERGNQ